MTDLKVWVDGVERIVRGVNGNTSCESVLIALANATGKSGKLALVEKWRDLERILPRDEKPFECLRMWGRLDREVKFILKDDSSHNKTENFSCSDKSGNHNGQINGSLEVMNRNSLERLATTQADKLRHLTRRLERVNLELECTAENEEDYLYFTDEEIAQDRATKLRHILDVQLRELSDLETCESELDKQKHICEKLTCQLDAQRKKLRLMELHVSDLEKVGRKLCSGIQNTKPDSKVASYLDNETFDFTDLQQEMTIAKEELCKQKILGERQTKERDRIQESFTELDTLIQLKNGELHSLGKDLTPSVSYYDLDEQLALADLTTDTSTEVFDDSFEVFREKCPVPSLSSRINGTQMSLATSSRRQKGTRARPQEDMRDLEADQGVFV